MGINYKLQGKNIYLDANIFIYLLEGYSEFVPFLTQLFELIDNGSIRAVTSELTLAETLVKPMADGNQSLQQIYKNTIQTSSMLQVVPVSRDILITSAKLRTNSLRLPDAIHLATAQASNCQIFLTNDKRLKIVSSIEIALVSEVKDYALSV